MGGKMTVCLVGSNGMIARCLASRLSGAGAGVTVLGRRAPEGYPYDAFIPTDLSVRLPDAGILSEADAVVYAAGAGARSGDTGDPARIYDLNVRVPVLLSQKLKETGYKGTFVSFGSSLEIGDNRTVLRPFTEEEVVSSLFPASDDYRLSKRMFTRYMQGFAAPFRHLHFLLPNLYSREDARGGDRLVPYTLTYLQRRVRERETLPLPRYSAGTQVRQFVVLEEAMEAVVRGLAADLPSGIWSVGGGECLSVRALVQRLFAIYGLPCPEACFGNGDRRDSGAAWIALDGTRLCQATGYRPEGTLEDVFSVQ